MQELVLMVGIYLQNLLFFSGDLLHLNCKSDFGSIRVVVTDEEGSVLDDFKAEILNEDSLDTIVRWEKGSLKQLAGKSVRLRFELSNAKLYSFWIE
jgi:hypothetical protein